jgi:hypothetical protein
MSRKIFPSLQAQCAKLMSSSSAAQGRQSGRSRRGRISRRDGLKIRWNAIMVAKAGNISLLFKDKVIYKGDIK